MESNDSSTIRSKAAQITAAIATVTMRVRCACDGVVAYISISMKAEQPTSWPHEAREKASRTARLTIPNATALRDAFQNGWVTTVCSRKSAGRIRYAPSTLGSLNVPRARLYSVKRS